MTDARRGMLLPVEKADAIVQAAWVKALARMQILVETINQQTNTPAMRSFPVAQARLSEEAAFTYIAEGLYANNLAIAMAVKHGWIPPDVLQHLEESSASYCVAALSGARFYCTGKGCDWRGDLKEVGPSGFCPKCKTQSLNKSPELVQAGAMPADPRERVPNGVNAPPIILEP